MFKVEKKQEVFSQRCHNPLCLTWRALVIIYIIYIFKNVDSVCDRSCFIISWDLWQKPEKYFDISTFLKMEKGEKWPGTVFHQRSDLFNKSLFFSEWNIYKYFPLSLGSAMFFFHSISPLCKSWLVFMADQVQAWWE